ncbi:MAG: adenosylcobinamide kinase / adenosylcobinamide-phosphate guanylyltransferase [Actinomycetota bacterium]
MTVTLVLGGTASGKSTVAERLVGALADDVVYLATGLATDEEMAARIAAHKLRRPPSWSTVETDDLPAAVRELPARPALIDSLGTWVAHAPDFAVDIHDLVVALQARTSPTVVVSDEVGLGVHPETEVGRRFRDVLGGVNRAVGDVADDVLLVVAGRILRLPAETAS